ncbi:DUF2863 family protein [Allopusillimonas soli]|uniref:DUF2863 family protein n=1 Tax=Allopusillimonas soli TaxID=659016 RepID=A0A853FF89_9BURK|nr:DUF2863 family protein [Allopusillimonas soli]NYT38352.1 DUF2863 family protein [Allopusillimonas soli]TEA72081.1 DUF2863 family protein [Allopusillimonas soli]
MTAPSPSRFSRDAQRLLALTTALARSGSRLEDIFWENQLGALLDKILLGKKSRTLENALEHLLATDTNAYEILVEQAETLSESTTLRLKDQSWDALLFSAPIVAWTRYQLPVGTLRPAQHAQLLDQIKTHIAASGTRVAVLPQLVGFDQMPQTFQDTRAWTQRLASEALDQNGDLQGLIKSVDADSMLADARFVVGILVAPHGEPLFRWQTTQDGQAASREACREAWVEAANPILAPLFTGCQMEYLQPDAYYVNSREADRRIRPLALKAAVTWLHNAGPVLDQGVRAVIAACGESVIEEYRIGFSLKQSNEVIYGCVWPVLSKEEAVADGMETGQVDVPDEIAALLKEMDVRDVRRLPGIYPAEFCDDCGAPYFPNPLGEMLHPEFPEEADPGPIHFH